MIDILRQIAVVLGALAFLGICWWAFSPKRKKRFEEDAKLPFADEEPSATDKESSALDNGGEKSGKSAENGDKKEQERQDKQ